MARAKRTFSPEFREEAVKLVIETSRPIAAVARDIGATFGTSRQQRGDSIHPQPWSLVMTFEPVFDFPLVDQPSVLIELDHGSDMNTPRMAVFGEVDALCADQLHDAVLKVLSRHRPTCIEMDLHGVSVLDSSGIRALLRCHADAQQKGCQLKLISTSRPVYRVLQVTGLVQHLGLTEQKPSDERNAGDDRAIESTPGQRRG